MLAVFIASFIDHCLLSVAGCILSTWCPGLQRVYVNVGGGAPVRENRRVRIFTPGLSPGDACYVDRTVSISLNNPTL